MSAPSPVGWDVSHFSSTESTVAAAPRSEVRVAVNTAAASSGPLPLAQRVESSPSMALAAGKLPSLSSCDAEAVTVPCWARSGSAARAGLTGRTAASAAVMATLSVAERVLDLGRNVIRVFFRPRTAALSDEHHAH